MDTVAIEINRGWHQAFIGLGTNMGDRNQNLTLAIEAIRATPGIEVLTQSTIIETEPWGYTDQDAFLNCVLKIRTTLPPHILMSQLLDIELGLKRERTIHWGPRTIDLDILFYDNLVTDDPHVILPHPRVQERAFVMESMAEIAPYFVHPLLNQRMAEILDNLKNA